MPLWGGEPWRRDWRRRERRQAWGDPEAAFQAQLRDIAALLRDAAVATVRLAGVEADSVIGALCAAPTACDLTVIVSSDYGFHQLVSDRVRVFDDVQKQLWDVAAVKGHYRLREPREVSAFKALAGHKGDGVKGVPRCGPVTARRVCAVLRRLLRAGRHQPVHQPPGGAEGVLPAGVAGAKGRVLGADRLDDGTC